jgi:hypothetical protein
LFIPPFLAAALQTLARLVYLYIKRDTTGEIIDPGLDLSSQTSKAAIPEVDIDVRWSGSLADENSTVGGLRPVP